MASRKTVLWGACGTLLASATAFGVAALTTSDDSKARIALTIALLLCAVILVLCAIALWGKRRQGREELHGIVRSLFQAAAFEADHLFSVSIVHTRVTDFGTTWAEVPKEIKNNSSGKMASSP